MKTLILFFVALLISLQPVIAQKNKGVDVPEKISSALNDRFSGIKGLIWSVDEKYNYIASFTYQKKPAIVTFTEAGVWLESKTEIDQRETPYKLTDYIKEKFLVVLENKIEAVYLLENPKETAYLVVIKYPGVKDDLKIYFKTSGDYIREEVPQEYNEKVAKRTMDPEVKSKSAEDAILNDDDF